MGLQLGGLLGSAAVLGLALPGLAMAQQAAPAGDAAAANSGGTPEIIVTAQRRAESSMKVATTLTVVQGGANLKSLGVVNTADLQNVSPGLEISKGPVGMNISLRGVQSSDQTSKGEQDVAFNVDSVYMGRPAEQQLAFFDIERVEVLRGPQGTLYGRSATAGAVNVITAAPKLDAYSGYLDGTFGNYNTRRLEGAINIPLTPTLALRVAGDSNYRDGFSHWYDQTVTTTKGSYFISSAGLPAHNDENNYSGRASLLWKPDDSFSARLTVTGGKLGGHGEVGADYENLMAAHEGASGLALPADPIPAWVDDHFWIYAIDVTKRAGPLQLTATASHQEYTMNDQITSGQNPAVNGFAFKLDQQQEHFKTDEAEFRITNAEKSAIDYTVGANYYREGIRENYHEWDAPVATWSDQSTWTPQIEPNNYTTHQSWGVYGQGTWHATDRLGVVAGLRYTHDEVTRVGTFGFGNYAGPCLYPNPCSGGNVSPNNGYESDNKLTWRVGLNFQMDPRNLFFADVATGFKGGGFNDIDPTKGIAAGSQPYAPETLTAYEIGYKGRPFANLTLTSSAFYNDFSAEQIAGNLKYEGDQITFTAVVPTHVYGWENEASWRPDRQTVIAASASVMHSAYGYYLAGGTYGSQVNWQGRALDKVPGFVGSLSLDRDFPIGGGSLIHVRLSSRYNSGYIVSAAGSLVQFHQSPFTRSDASIGLVPEGSRWRFELFVRNIENKVQMTGEPDIYFGPTGTAANNFTPGPGTYPNGSPFPVSDPRTYGARLRISF